MRRGSRPKCQSPSVTRAQASAAVAEPRRSRQRPALSLTPVLLWWSHVCLRVTRHSHGGSERAAHAQLLQQPLRQAPRLAAKEHDGKRKGLVHSLGEASRARASQARASPARAPGAPGWRHAGGATSSSTPLARVPGGLFVGVHSGLRFRTLSRRRHPPQPPRPSASAAIRAL